MFRQTFSENDPLGDDQVLTLFWYSYVGKTAWKIVTFTSALRSPQIGTNCMVIGKIKTSWKTPRFNSSWMLKLGRLLKRKNRKMLWASEYPEFLRNHQDKHQAASIKKLGFKTLATN